MHSSIPEQRKKHVEIHLQIQREIPPKWILARLIDLCGKKPQYGAAISAIQKNEHLPRYIRITDLNDDGSLRQDEWMSIEEEDAKPYELKVGDILFARTGATVGKTYYYQKAHGKCAFAGYLIRFVPQQSKLDVRFLFYYTHSTNYWRWLRSIQTEGVQPNVNAEQYSNMLILVPPFEEQQKIASILSNVDELIQKVEETIKHTQILKKALMQKLLSAGIGHAKFKSTELGRIPEKWQIYKISEIAQLVMGQSPPGDSYNLVNNGTALLNGPTEFGDENPIAVQFTTAPTKLCKNGDILLCVRGSTTGRLNIADGIYCIGRGLAAISGLKDKTFTKWLYYHFVRLQDYIYNIASGGGSTFPNINRDLIEGITLPYPDINEQNKIALIITSVDNYIKQNKIIKKNILNVKIGLMQMLLTGKIRVKV